MSQYRDRLPMLSSGLFATDGGLETTLIFHDRLDLPCFASFALLGTSDGTRRLRKYFDRYCAIGARYRMGIVLEAATWRANADWGRKLGYDEAALGEANRLAIKLLAEVRANWQRPDRPCVISGNLGPRGDGYSPATRMSTAESRGYHGAQIRTFAETEADLVSAFTMNYTEEAIGIVHAARASAIPVVISFTVETDGRLPSGDTLEAAILRTDAETHAYPAYYMINCAHPAHFDGTLRRGGNWLERIRGLRTNASKRSHAELDNSTDLDAGDPQALGEEHRSLRALLPKLAVVGGCCGTDDRHVEAICRALS